MILFDGRGAPALRTVLGTALGESTEAAFAIRRIRLARVDFLPEELRHVRRCRVLLGRLDADTLADAGATPSSARAAALLDMASAGRLEVRSASLLTWDPDFALVGHGTESDLLLFGSIQFASPLPARSVEELSLSCAMRDATAARAAAARFEDLWDRAHDTLEAVMDALVRARSMHDG